MLVDILKDKKFDLIFSFLMGIFITIVLRPVCKGDTCYNLKAPPPTEIKEHAYKAGDRCYRFVPEETKCPMTGVVEPFAWSALNNRAVNE